MLLVINGDGSSMIIDSHQHKTTGAIIAFAAPGQADSLALWFTKCIMLPGTMTLGQLP